MIGTHATRHRRGQRAAVAASLLVVSFFSFSAWSQDDASSDAPAGDCRMLVQVEDLSPELNATPLLATLERRVEARGFTVVGAELTEDLLRDKEAAEALRREHDVPYLLILQALPRSPTTLAWASRRGCVECVEHVAIRIELYGEERVERTYAITEPRAYTHDITVDRWLAAAEAICPGAETAPLRGEAISAPELAVTTGEMMAEERASERTRREAASAKKVTRESQYRGVFGLNVNRRELFSTVGLGLTNTWGKSPSGLTHHLDLGLINYLVGGGFDGDSTEYTKSNDFSGLEFSLGYGLGFGFFDSDGDSLAAMLGASARALMVMYKEGGEAFNFVVEPYVGLRGNSGELGYAITFGQVSGVSVLIGFGMGF